MKKKIRHADNSLHDLMPSEQMDQETLIKRAKQFAHVKKVEDKSENIIGSVCVRLGHEDKYSIPFHDIVEVCSKESITAIPKVPAIISGVTNWRGKLLTVIDLGKFFAINAEGTQGNDSVIVVSGQGVMVGLLVKDVVGSQDYDLALLEPPLPMKGIVKPEYVIGLVGGVIAVLNIKHIFSDIQQEIKKWRM